MLILTAALLFCYSSFKRQPKKIGVEAVSWIETYSDSAGYKTWNYTIIMPDGEVKKFHMKYKPKKPI